MSILDSTADRIIELYEWIKKINFTQFRDKLMISKSKHPFDLSAFSAPFRGEDHEAFDIEDQMNFILKTRIENAISKIFTDEMIEQAIQMAGVEEIAKEKIGKAIKARVERDASDIVDEALGDLEDNFAITSQIENYVTTKLLQTFN